MASPLHSLMQVVFGYQASEILYTVTRLGLAVHLKSGPKTGEEIAALAHTHPENTTRLLRAAASLGLFDRDPSTLAFSLNPLSDLFVGDEPSSLKWVILHNCSPYTINPWQNLDKAVQDGSYPHKEAHGTDCFGFYAKNPAASTEFNNAMTSLSTHFPVASALTTHYSFKDHKHVIDIGGGHGALLSLILRSYPHLQGTAFDLPHVIEDAKGKTATSFSDIASRFSFSPGSFFDTIPSGGDVYTLKYIVHDWDDEKSIEILKNIAKVLPANGKVILLETLLRETGDTHGSMLDLHMLVLNNAKERTEAQFQHLFKSAGLKIVQFLPLPPSTVHAIIGEKL